MRRDLQPGRKSDDSELHFRLLGVPPADWISLKSGNHFSAAEPAP
jgi:hypothetical protein